MIKTDPQTIETLLNRGTSQVIVKEDLARKLQSGQKLRIKLGIDPTGTDLHLGHAVVFRKLKQFQDAGHTIIFLFGGFTATIGDPTGKNETRPPLTLAEVESNSVKYLDQAAKIIDIQQAEIRNNREWLEPMTGAEILKLLAQKSAQQILARRDFKNRYDNEIDIQLHEFLYPMMQGYDSVALKSDVEIGGTDQLFNVLVGRDLQKKYGETVIQDIMTLKILVGTDGVEKMSKSLDNYIAIDAEPWEMFGKIMSIPDSAMLDYFELLTDIDLDEATSRISKSPRDAKVYLAKDIITFFHSVADADKAEQDFITKFVKKDIPDAMPEFTVAETEIGILDLLTKVTQFTASNSEARRLVQAGAVSLDGKKIANPTAVVCFTSEPQVLKAGKLKFGRIKTE